MGGFKGAEMPQQPKVQKLTRKEDRLMELPEGILYAIFSKLTLKEALRTSSLSKDWRLKWTCHPYMSFNSNCISRSIAYSHGLSNLRLDTRKRHQRCKFIKQVDRIMNLRLRGPKMDSLTICYNLGEDCASHINRWIKYAIRKGVENLNLDLSEQCSLLTDDSSSTTYRKYTFNFTLLAPSTNECVIKHLQLASCILSPIPWSNILKSLVKVELKDVNISDLQMKSFLLTCPSLERLTLDSCEDLVNIEFADLSLRLKFLSILNCWRLKTIDLYAEDLLVFDYTGQWIKFSFKRVPRLADMFLTFTGTRREEGVSYAFSRLCYDVPQLTSLNLVCLMSLENLKLAENVHAFSNIKQLLLTVLPFHDEDELCWVGYVLKAFPMLQKLGINLFSPSYIKQTDRVNRHLAENRHGHLTELAINGFNGYPHEVELVKHLLNNATGLKALVITRSKILYRGSHNWPHERPSSWCKLSKETVEWLHAAVPPTVDLQVQD